MCWLRERVFDGDSPEPCKCVIESCPWALSAQMYWTKDDNQRRGCLSRENCLVRCGNQEGMYIQRPVYSRESIHTPELQFIFRRMALA